MKENCARVCGLCSSIGEGGKNCVDKAGYSECSTWFDRCPTSDNLNTLDDWDKRGGAIVAESGCNPNHGQLAFYSEASWQCCEGPVTEWDECSGRFLSCDSEDDVKPALPATHSLQFRIWNAADINSPDPSFSDEIEIPGEATDTFTTTRSEDMNIQLSNAWVAKSNHLQTVRASKDTGSFSVSFKSIVGSKPLRSSLIMPFLPLEVASEAFIYNHVSGFTTDKATHAGDAAFLVKTCAVDALSSDCTHAHEMINLRSTLLSPAVVRVLYDGTTGNCPTQGIILCAFDARGVVYAGSCATTDDEGYATVNVPGFADSVTIKNGCPKDVSASTGFIDLTGDQLCSDEEDGVKTGRSLSVADSFRATDAHKYTVDSPMVFYELTKRKVKVMLGVGIVEPFVVQDDDASSDTHAIYDAAMNARTRKCALKNSKRLIFYSTCK